MGATHKQKLVAKKIRENPRISVSRAMLEAGYSPNTAQHPQDLTESKGWEELMGTYLDAENSVRIHADMLEATKLSRYSFPKDMTDMDIRRVIEGATGSRLINIQTFKNSKKAYYVEPDINSRIKALDMAYKITGKYNTKPVDLGHREQIDELSERLRNMIGAK